jgi:hypothetical protein
MGPPPRRSRAGGPVCRGLCRSRPSLAVGGLPGCPASPGRFAPNDRLTRVHQPQKPSRPPGPWATGADSPHMLPTHGSRLKTKSRACRFPVSSLTGTGAVGTFRTGGFTENGGPGVDVTAPQDDAFVSAETPSRDGRPPENGSSGRSRASRRSSWSSPQRPTWASPGMSPSTSTPAPLTPIGSPALLTPSARRRSSGSGPGSTTTLRWLSS